MPLYELIPWFVVLASVFCAGLAAFSYSRLHAPTWLERNAAGQLLIAFSVFSVVLLCLAAEIVARRRERLHELAQFVTPYPGAMPQFIFFKNVQGMWMLVTPDSFEKVRAFYTGLADAEKTPFQHIRDSDTRFVFGQGAHAVSIDVDALSGGTTISYQVPAGPQAF